MLGRVAIVAGLAALLGCSHFAAVKTTTGARCMPDRTAPVIDVIGAVAAAAGDVAVLHFAAGTSGDDSSQGVGAAALPITLLLFVFAINAHNGFVTDLCPKT